ncbi:MAG: hypothetical protein R3C26_17875 [Calditrichia bacterium]
MKKAFRANSIISIAGLILTSFLCATFAGEIPEKSKGADDKEVAPLVLQVLNYTENPVDIPNPDRGFERGNDDAAGWEPLSLINRAVQIIGGI